jgi:predicted cupin superfamily sugar epimerase
VSFSREQAEAIIAQLQLEMLPVEPILFRQTWRRTEGNEVLGTVMLGAMLAESFSVMHRLTADEAWHFYSGDPIELLLLHPDGSHSMVILGSNPLANQTQQLVVPAGTWMGGRLISGGVFALFGNTMTPGFTSERFEGGDRTELCAKWPAASTMITALTHDETVRDMPKGY